MKISKRRVGTAGVVFIAAGIGFMIFTLGLSPRDAAVGKDHIESEPVREAGAGEVVAQGAGTVAEVGRNLDPVTPTREVGSAIENSEKPRQVIPGTSVRERLGEAELLATKESVLPNGTVRRSRLLKIAGKFPFVIFEGTLPERDPNAPDEMLTAAIAKVADHMLVRPASGVSEDAFRTVLKEAGFLEAEQLAPNGAWMVRLPEVSIDALETAMGQLEANPHYAYAEPDYLIFPADIPSATIPLEERNGVLVRADTGQPVNPSSSDKAYRFDAASMEDEVRERLADAPPGSRVLTFDNPGFTGGPGTYNPSLEEQNFVLSSTGGLDVPVGNEATYPNNGTYHLRNAWNTLTIQHIEGLPFSISSIDLAEFSTSPGTAATFTFTGHKKDGTQVTQSFTTDGIIDGPGPLEDFETFSFDSNFTNLTKVVMSTRGMSDNIVVLVEEPESPAPTPPQAPLVYDLTFDAPKHTVGSLTGVSGPFAPSSIMAGTPTVRAAVGTLTGPALEFKGTLSHQIRFGMRKEAVAYRVEFDAYLDLPNDFTVNFDGLGALTQAIAFRSNGTISVLQNNQLTHNLGTYVVKKNMQVMIDLDVENSEWELFVNGASKFKRALLTSNGDLQDIRMGTTETQTRVAGVDNLRISAFTSDNAPTLGSRLTVAPESLSFPEIAVGNNLTWNLELSNTGKKALNIQGATSNSGSFTVPGNYSVSLIPGGVTSLPITFAPTATGIHSGKITITSDDSYQPSLSVSVTGIGVNAPILTLAPLDMDVTMEAGTTGTQAYAVGNAGAAVLRWNMVLGGGSGTGPGIIPNDPNYSALWGMRKPGPSVGGIDAPHAWMVTTGSNDVVIAVIDTGVDRAHADLQGNMWTNPGEIAGNGVDDDRNGFIDDVHGWDFGDNDSNPTDPRGHGTHVAGTIAARGNNGVGVSGVCWNARIMAVKFFPTLGPGSTSDAVRCVNYVRTMGAKVSNNSWGGGAYSQSLRDAIAQAGQAGSLFVASAGNEAWDNDIMLTYPASYTLDSIVAVASTDESERLSYFSNYGATTVDLAAPGSNVLSLQPGGTYFYRSGTSMAAPHVTGVVGLLLSRNPNLTPAEMKQLLLYGTDSLPSLSGKVLTRGRINASTTVRAALPTWLKPAPGNGTVPVQQSRQLVLTVDATNLAPGQYAETLALSSNDPSTPNYQLPISVKVVAGDAYTAWLRNHFGTGNLLKNGNKSSVWDDRADSDGDGVATILEYVTGRNPTVSNSGAVIAMVDSVEKIFEFNARPNDSSISYHVEWSETLQGDWRRDRLQVVEDSTEGMPPGIHRIRVKLSGELPASAFFRLAAGRSS
jgi:subtilisin family serine protease